MMRSKTTRSTVVLLSLVVLLALAGIVQADGPIPVASGFNGPQGVMVDSDGAVWVIDTNAVTKVASNGSKTTMATLPTAVGPEGNPVGGARLASVNGMVLASNGQWDTNPNRQGDPPAGIAAILKIGNGAWSVLADTWAFEKTNNPDPSFVDSHPYGMTVGSDGMLYVADAGGNTLLKVNPANGQIFLVAVLPGVSNSSGVGPPMAEAVPTGVVRNSDGSFYVSYLPGFPFLPGSSKVVTVAANGAISDYAIGLTSMTDLRRGPDGNLYGVQFAIYGQQGPAPNSGALVRIKPGSGSVTLLSGLNFPTSVDFNSAGDAYITINGVGAPESGAVVKYTNVAPPPSGANEVPEPATLILLGAGLAGLAGYARNRRNRKAVAS